MVYFLEDQFFVFKELFYFFFSTFPVCDFTVAFTASKPDPFFIVHCAAGMADPGYPPIGLHNPEIKLDVVFLIPPVICAVMLLEFRPVLRVGYLYHQVPVRHKLLRRMSRNAFAGRRYILK